MWIYSKGGKLRNTFLMASIQWEAGRVCAEYENPDRRIILSDDAADLNRIYNAMNAGVAVLDLRGEQHG